MACLGLSNPQTATNFHHQPTADWLIDTYWWRCAQSCRGWAVWINFSISPIPRQGLQSDKWLQDWCWRSFDEFFFWGAFLLNLPCNNFHPGNWLLLDKYLLIQAGLPKRRKDEAVCNLVFYLHYFTQSVLPCKNPGFLMRKSDVFCTKTGFNARDEAYKQALNVSRSAFLVRKDAKARWWHGHVMNLFMNLGNSISMCYSFIFDTIYTCI